MKGFALVASLAFAFGAASASAQQPPQQQSPQQQQPQQQPPATQQPKPAPPMLTPPQPPAPFPQGAKIAWVDFQRIANESSEGKASTAKIQALIQKKQTEGQEKSKQLQANQQKLQTSSAMMNEQARAQLEKEIERQQVDGQRFQQDAQAEINELQTELQNEFQKKLIPLLTQLAQEKGLQLLLSRADAGIIWSDPGIDLTSEVIKKLDASSAKPATPKP